ncbi:MAG: S-layer homology domain-containing protein [Bacilli bacterium]|nr:S-layer homology domain-containing protein [Bacilli bacterium]
MRKKLFSLLLVLLIVLSSTMTAFGSPLEELGKGLIDITKEFMQSLINEAVSKFKDLKATDWFAEVMTRLSVLGGINGYPDGTLRPNGTITKGEFTKMLLGTLKHEVESAKSGHWAMPWVEKAYSLGYISPYDKEWVYSEKQLDEPITRELIADMIMRSTRETVVDPAMMGIPHFSTYHEQFQLNMSDYWAIYDPYKKSVLNAYGLGIINGYPDGTFRPKNNATRAEASAMIVRLIDKDARIKQEPKGKEVYSGDPEVQYVNSLAKKYPDNSIIKDKWNWRYDSTKKPTTGVMNSGLTVRKVPPYTTKERDYTITLFNNHTEKDREVLKEVLKEFYPTGYEKAYKQIISRFNEPANSLDMVDRLDDRNILYGRYDNGVDITIGLQGNKAVWN